MERHPSSRIRDLLRHYRVAAALSQEALAARAGVSARAISDLERGVHRAPRLETIRLLADGLGLKEDDRARLLSAARADLFRPAAGPSALPSSGALPVPLTRLIGRERELAILRDRVQDEAVRWLTLTGPGGVGKTRLAIAVASGLHEHFPDGIVFVDLSPLTDPDLVVPAIAAALGVRQAAGRPVVETVATVLAPKRLLLVLDNCERVLSGEPELSRLLAASLGLTIFATSREPFHVRGEYQVPVLPLPLPLPCPEPASAAAIEEVARSAAITLFVERARAAQPEFALTAENAGAVVAICQWLDGLPLAIELAAARVSVLLPSALLARLEKRLPFLTHGARDLPARQQTMREAIAWSHDLLLHEEQVFFRRLAVFAGGFTLEAAEWMADALPTPDTSPVVDLLAGLLDKCLLHSRFVHGADPRFTMLETVREFALEMLTARGEAVAAEAAHAAYMLALAERAEPELFGPDERRWHANLALELDNLRAALAWGLAHDVATTLRIGGALWVYWAWYQVGEGRRWLGAALARSVSSPALIEARALTTDAALAILAGDVPGSLTSSAAAVSSVQASAHPVRKAEAQWIRAGAHFFAGDEAAAIPELDAALALFEHATTTADRGRGAYAWSVRGSIAFGGGDESRGLQFLDEALARARVSGSDGVTIIILGDFAGWLVDRDETTRARGMLEEALALAADHPGIWLQAAPLIGLALVEAIEGEAATAARHLGAVERLRASGEIDGRLQATGGVNFPAHFQRRAERATALARSALGKDRFAAMLAAGRSNMDGAVKDRRSGQREG